jgi:hypothetical protein
MSLLRSAKKLTPILMTLAATAYLVATVDLGAAFSQMDSHAALVLIPALLVYGALSLVIEAMTLVRLVPSGEGVFDVWKAARVKAASYLMNLIHYALGAGALVLLLRRRAGIGVVDSAGIVVLIAMIDLGVLLVIVALGITLLTDQASQVQVGVILILIGVIYGGFAALRAPFSLGLLDGLRSHRVFRAARTTPSERLLETGALRLLFVLCFLGLGWAALSAFHLPIPLGDFLVNFPAAALAAFLPSVAGIGPGQVGMVELFSRFADRESLLACSLALSAGLILLRVGIGVLFAREYAREAYAASRETEAQNRTEATTSG